VPAARRRSIRFADELAHGANAGLAKGVTAYLGPIQKRHPAVSWADLIQLGSATAVSHAGGPTIAMRYGRVDVPTAQQCPPAGRLPDAAPPFGDGAPDAASHLRAVFYRMGFDDAEIVALSGAHTLGRAFKERSGATAHGYGNAGATAHTRDDAVARADGRRGVGMPGGQSWTPRWLRFDNSYFAPADDPALLRLPTDAVLATDAGFRPHFLRFGGSQDAFFKEYAAAHAKLAELGSAFRPPGGIVID
jgi:L-ascorbate peroxidase